VQNELHMQYTEKKTDNPMKKMTGASKQGEPVSRDLWIYGRDLRIT